MYLFVEYKWFRTIMTLRTLSKEEWGQYVLKYYNYSKIQCIWKDCHSMLSASTNDFNKSLVITTSVFPGYMLIEMTRICRHTWEDRFTNSLRICDCSAQNPRWQTIFIYSGRLEVCLAGKQWSLLTRKDFGDTKTSWYPSTKMSRKVLTSLNLTRGER